MKKIGKRINHRSTEQTFTQTSKYKGCPKKNLLRIFRKDRMHGIMKLSTSFKKDISIQSHIAKKSVFLGHPV